MTKRLEMKVLRSLVLVLAISLPACTPDQAPSSVNPSESALPSSPIQAGPGLPQSGSTLAGNASQPVVESRPKPTPSVGFVLPENLAGIRFEERDRFLNALGQTTRFAVYLLDRQGQRIDFQVPLEWSSSRPQDFSVDDQGNLKALVNDGFSVIVAKIPGTSFEARTTINVTTWSPTSGGGGGGSLAGNPAVANSPPVIKLFSSSTFNVTGGGGLVKLLGDATDAQSTLLDSAFSWSCSPQPDCGQFTPASGPTVYWQSPATGGNYIVTLTVSDGSLQTSQNITLVVQAGNGNLQVNAP